MIGHAVSDDSKRFSMTGINFCATKNGTELVATDARQIAMYKGIKLTDSNVIAPDVFVKAMLKIAPQGPIKLTIADGVITVISEETEISSKLLEATFPSWKNAVPQRSDQCFSCGRKALINALQTCSIFLADRQAPRLEMKGAGKGIEVSLPGKAKAMVLGTELSGQPAITVHVNAKQLIENLAVMEQENVRIQCAENMPLLIEEGPFLAVINRMIPPAS